MDIKIENDEIVIRAKLTVGTPSKSRKSLVVATTNGFVKAGGYSVSVNVIKER